MIAALCILAVAPHGGRTAASGPATTVPDSTVDDLPPTPAGEQLAWVLSEGATASAAEWTARLGPAMLDVVTPQAARDATASVVALAGPDGFAITGIDEQSDYELTVTVATSDGSAVDIVIVVTEEPPHVIEQLGATPSAGSLPEPPVGPAEIEARLAAAAPDAAMLVSAVDGEPLVAVNADEAGPIGSAFKLYVLGAVVDAISAGEVSWDDELLIAENLRSLPSGELQDRPAGSTTTVEEAATLMISISDNTAADLLIDLIGVDAVEQNMATMGASPESIDRTLPFLTTRQLFTLKWTQDDETLEEYAEADTATRRTILAALPAELPEVTAVDPAIPVFPHEIEWFSSPVELGAALTWLVERTAEDGLAPLAAVLGTNPGIELDPQVWSSFAFKGGSEPGVISLSWFLTRADGRQFVASVQASDRDAAIDELDVVSIAIGAIELAAVSG